ncbi:2OG-Fe(II) oxygenase [Streptacidiphilus sp. MAP5-52]|uniref:2OG-Fe(II) oxygenase n=1 Tax=Streptacidiphilus sp. MAP5-52 TaxID=3156267 RepID=UPI00351971FB
MTRTTLGDPLFATEQATELTARSMGQLISGTLGALTVPGALTTAESAAVLRAVAQLPAQTYNPERVEGEITRFGPALNDYRRPDGVDLTAYWQQADLARARWTALELTTDPMVALLDRIGQAWGAPVAPATISGRPVWGMTIREINRGSLVHYDEAVREIPGVLDQDIVGQLAVNAFAVTPSRGGETRLWRKRWQPSDQRFAQGYGYLDVVVFSRQQLTITPQAGQLNLFCPSWYHQVQPVLAGRRVSLSCFLGYTLDGQLVCWS